VKRAYAIHCPASAAGPAFPAGHCWVCVASYCGSAATAAGIVAATVAATAAATVAATVAATAAATPAVSAVAVTAAATPAVSAVAVTAAATPAVSAVAGIAAEAFAVSDVAAIAAEAFAVSDAACAAVTAAHASAEVESAFAVMADPVVSGHAAVFAPVSAGSGLTPAVQSFQAFFVFSAGLIVAAACQFSDCCFCLPSGRQLHQWPAGQGSCI